MIGVQHQVTEKGEAFTRILKILQYVCRDSHLCVYALLRNVYSPYQVAVRLQFKVMQNYESLTHSVSLSVDQ